MRILRLRETCQTTSKIGIFSQNSRAQKDHSWSTSSYKSKQWQRMNFKGYWRIAIRRAISCNSCSRCRVISSLLLPLRMVHNRKPLKDYLQIHRSIMEILAAVMARALSVVWVNSVTRYLRVAPMPKTWPQVECQTLCCSRRPTLQLLPRLISAWTTFWGTFSLAIIRRARTRW